MGTRALLRVAGIEGDGRITLAVGVLGVLLLFARRESGVFIALQVLIVRWPGLSRPTPRAEYEPLKLDALPTTGSFGSRMPRGTMIAFAAFVLGGGVATAVALLCDDSSAKENVAGVTTTESSPGTQV